MPPAKKKSAQTVNLQAGTHAWQPCLLTWYDPALGGTNSSNGQKNPHDATASGEPYDPAKFTCAAPPAYPFGTILTFRYAQNEVTCRVNDRGGAIQGHHFDLSRGAAQQLGIIQAGSVTAQFTIGGSPGSAKAAPANNVAAVGGGGGGIGSILDLLTSPVDAIGGFLAQIAVNLLKDAAIGVADTIILPAWNWNLRAVDQYQQDMFGDKSGKQLLWTALFWGGGYWLLFTDPSKGNLAPSPVRNSRLARHTRFAQSLPARHSLVKPKDVKSKTPKKPKPVPSRATVTQTGTMQTTRTQRVKVTGNNVGERNGSQNDGGTESVERIERAGSLPTAKRNSTQDAPGVPHPEHGAGSRSLPNRRRDSKRRPGEGGGGGR